MPCLLTLVLLLLCVLCVFVVLFDRMHPARCRQRPALAVFFQPQTGLDALADLHQPRHRPLAEQPLAIRRRDGEDQLEVLAVAERMVQRRLTRPPAQFDRIGMHRHRVRDDDRGSATAEQIVMIGAAVIGAAAVGVIIWNKMRSGAESIQTPSP